MAEQVQQEKGQACLDQIDALCGAIECAMAAISGGSLASFEESLWRQEGLCGSLKHTLCAAQSHAFGKVSGDVVNERTQAAVRALNRLNQTYAELLKQAQSSNQRLYTLCHSYGYGSPREEISPDSMHCYVEA